MEQALIKLGLSEKEAKVYLSTLELGEDTVQNIGKKAGVNRATTYVILEKLMGLGLVSSIEHDKKTKFIAENPSELTNIINEQQRELEGRKHHLNDLMSQLMAVYNTKKGKPIVRYFEGPDGLEALDRYGKLELSKGSEILAFIPIDLVEELFPSRRKAALDYRIKLGIHSRAIYTHTKGAISHEVNESELREAMFIPREQFPLSASIQIFPKWGIKLFNFERGNFFGVLIQSPSLASNMKLVFDLSWEAAKSRQHQKKD
ncbi:MAG: helix-turn-helix domain-containing protein [Candidatus Berkelbacteria bacterium]|nr:helix-turn-helix domain-containing protein [Candidatus Berkelbacteria bacterium]